MLRFFKPKYELYDMTKDIDGNIRISILFTKLGIFKTMHTYTLSIRMQNEYFWHLKMGFKFLSKVNFTRDDGKEVIRFSDCNDLSKILYASLVILCLKAMTKIYANYKISKTSDARGRNIITKNKKIMYLVTDNFVEYLKYMIRSEDFDGIHKTFLRFIRYEKLDVNFKYEPQITECISTTETDAVYSINVLPSIACGDQRTNDLMFILSRNELLPVYNGCIDLNIIKDRVDYDASVYNILISFYKEFLDIKYS